MGYTRMGNISRFAGLGQSGEALWMVDASAIKAKLKAVSSFSTWTTYRNLEREWIRLIDRTNVLIEDVQQKAAVIKTLTAVRDALPGLRKKKRGKVYLAKKLIRATDDAIDIVTGKTTIITKVEIVPAAQDPSVLPVIPTGPEKEPVKTGAGSTTMLVAMGALIAGLFLLKK